MKVLIPVQDDIFGEAITNVIAQHKWPAGSSFRLVTIIEYTTYGEMLGEMYCCEATRAIYDERVAKATKLLQEYATKLDYAMPGSFVEHKILYGLPKELVLQEATEWKADMIVMGSHARRGLNRFLLGSVSTAILQEAPCSVIIVKLPKEEQEKLDKTKTAKRATPHHAHSHSHIPSGTVF